MTTEPSSWGEYIKAIEIEKRSPALTRLEPVKMQKTADRKKCEREFDPVGMRFRDEAKEEAFLTSTLSKTLQRSLTVQNEMKNTFNIVTHVGPAVVTTQRMQPKLSKKPLPREFHILSNLKTQVHKFAPLATEAILYEPDDLPKAAPRRAAAVRRDFDILSNNYKQNDSARKLDELQQLKNKITSKYWSTHNFDVVRGIYYDDNKEDAYHEQRRFLETVQGKAQSLRQPPSFAYSEGQSYNILNGSNNVAFSNEEKVKASHALEMRKMNRIKTLEVEDRWRRSGELDGLKKDEKQLNRASYKRWESEQTRGFDIVTSLPHEENRPQSFAVRPITIWGKLTRSANSDIITTSIGIVNEGDDTNGDNTSTDIFKCSSRSTALSSRNTGYDFVTSFPSSLPRYNSLRAADNRNRNTASPPLAMETIQRNNNKLLDSIGTSPNRDEKKEGVHGSEMGPEDDGNPVSFLSKSIGDLKVKSSPSGASVAPRTNSLTNKSIDERNATHDHSDVTSSGIGLRTKKSQVTPLKLPNQQSASSTPQSTAVGTEPVMMSVMMGAKEGMAPSVRTGGFSYANNN